MRHPLIGALSLVLLVSGCDYDNGNARRFDDRGAAGQPGAAGADSSNDDGCSQDSTPAQSTIDVDAQLLVEAGQGAGVFLEYAQGGHWTLRTSCDTSDCAWDIIVTPEDKHTIGNVVPQDLEAGDQVLAYDDDDPSTVNTSVQLLATTGRDIDGFTFDSDPAAAMRVDALLDGQCARRYFYWYGDGGLHNGSPTNPLDLIPSGE